MGKAILAFISTLTTALIFVSVGEAINWPELGLIFPMALMGSFIIYFNESKK